jgi:hypothetical protein
LEVADILSIWPFAVLAIPHLCKLHDEVITAAARKIA